jgi:hypothetical protein
MEELLTGRGRKWWWRRRFRHGERSCNRGGDFLRAAAMGRVGHGGGNAKKKKRAGSSPAYRSGENRAARELGAGEEKNGGEEGVHLL